MELRERHIAKVEAVEFLVFLNGLLLETQTFQGARLAEYPSALAAVVLQYETDGWVRDKQADSRKRETH
jgi:hypothetical protein